MYRTGHWADAVAALREAFRRAKGSERAFEHTATLFFLAMAQWRCGEQKGAMESYREAVQRMEHFFDARDTCNRALRAEAAALLGIPEPPTPKAKEQSTRK